MGFGRGVALPEICTEKSLVSSLVITLAGDERMRAEALQLLVNFPDLELGQVAGAWVPAVLESVDAASVIAALEALPGVLFVEVVFVEVLSL